MSTYIIHAIANCAMRETVYFANLDYINRGIGSNFWTANSNEIMRFNDEQTARIVCELVSQLPKPYIFSQTFHLMEIREGGDSKTIGTYSFAKGRN